LKTKLPKEAKVEKSAKLSSITELPYYGSESDENFVFIAY